MNDRPKRAGAQRETQRLLHLLDFEISGGPLLRSGAHDIQPQDGVADERANVRAQSAAQALEVLGKRLPIERDRAFEQAAVHVLDRAEELDQAKAMLGPHRRERHRAITHDQRGHAVFGRGCRKLVPAQLWVVVRMNVDKAGRDYSTIGVDLLRGRSGDLAHGDDTIAHHADVTEIRRPPGSVNDAGVADCEREWLRRHCNSPGRHQRVQAVAAALRDMPSASCAY